MSYIARVLVKTLMVPIFLVLCIPALILFIFNPETNKLKLVFEK
jgi:hypothetical protein